MAKVTKKLLIGSEEWCAFPSIGIAAVKARVDSGAKTSCLHAVNISQFQRGGRQWVSFDVHPLQGDRRTIVHCQAEVVDKRSVKSSSGESERRTVVKVALHLGEFVDEIELTLTNRDSMGYRMLLGREAMAGRMLVDPSASFLNGERSASELARLYKKQVKTKQAGLAIGVLASDANLYSNTRLIEAGQQRGHQIQFVDIRHCYMRIDADTPEIHSRGGSKLPSLDAIIPRIRPSLTFYGCSLVRQFESMATYTLNGSTAIARSRDKLFSLQMLIKSDLNIPLTGFAHSPIDTDSLIDLVGGAPLVIKLLEGTQGKGVVLAETKKAAESVIHAFKSLQANLLVQEFVKEADGRSLRLFVIDGKVVAAIERSASAGEFRANIQQGGSAEAVKITAEERRLAIKAAKTFDLAVAGVDVIRSRRGPLLLEVSPSPGLETLETATGVDIASLMIVAIEKKLNWRLRA